MVIVSFKTKGWTFQIRSFWYPLDPLAYLQSLPQLFTVLCVCCCRYKWQPCQYAYTKYGPSKDIQRQEGPRYDIERFEILEAFGSLRQCDLIVVQGTVTRKMAPRLRMVYDQMPEPKYVIAMGTCVITGGLHIDSYNVLPGIDGIIQVDVYVPGCPPRPRH